MVSQEVLRLYPGVAFVSWEALKDVKLGNLHVPKGVNMWIWLLALHRDPELWGPEANKFNPGRFASGISRACKCPHAYIPFGVGVRMCPGQSLAVLEIKVMFALILANFTLSLSCSYRNVPNFGLLLSLNMNWICKFEGFDHVVWKQVILYSCIDAKRPCVLIDALLVLVTRRSQV